MAPDQDLDAIVARIRQREKTALRRSILYSFVPVVVAVAVLGYTGYRVNETGKKLAETKEQLAKATDFKRLVHPLTAEEIKRIASRDGAAKQGEVLGEILRLQTMGVSWHLSGNSPDVGFDSPSFAAYVLRQADVSVGESRPGVKLSEQLKDNLANVAQPASGDLLFYPGGYALFYFEDMKGEPFVIGMTPFGIVSLNPGFDRPNEIRRPAYS